MWFTENAWPPIIILSVVAVILFGLWQSQRRSGYLAGVVIALFAAVGVYFVEGAIVTEAELIETSVQQMVAACERGDIPATVGFIAPQEVALQLQIAAAMALVDVENDVRVTDLDVRMVAGGTQAVSHFRANATIGIKSMGHRARHPSRWELTWQKTGDDWKVIEIQRLNVVDGRAMDLMNRAE